MDAQPGADALQGVGAVRGTVVVEQVRQIQQGVLAPGEQATVALQHCRCRRIGTNGFDNRVGRITRHPVAQWDFIHARIP